MKGGKLGKEKKNLEKGVLQSDDGKGKTTLDSVQKLPKMQRLIKYAIKSETTKKKKWGDTTKTTKIIVGGCKNEK